MADNTQISSPVSLLIIDDNQTILELLSRALNRQGVEILTASDPVVGLDLFCSRRPRIVLTDLMMPRIGGMEVLEKIMAIDPSTHVIVITAHYSRDSAAEAFKKGARDYLNKPISISMLRQRVGKLLAEIRQ